MSRKQRWSTVLRFADNIRLVIISPISVLKDRVACIGTLTGWSKDRLQKLDKEKWEGKKF